MENYKLSKLAENSNSLSISNLSEKVDEKNHNGDEVFNFTLGDFAPKEFPIPIKLEEEIIKAYREKKTNYPFIGGMKELRQAISNHIKLHGQFEYDPSDIIVASGVRPLIYLIFKTLLDPKEKAIYTAPSWNTQHFIDLASATPVIVEAKPENNFLITPEELKPHIKDAVIVNLNSPLNPCGTIFDQNTLKEIFDMIVEENRKRAKEGRKFLYVLFDIIYWLMIYTESKYTNPLSLNPKIKDYMVFIDGISKCFAATGVRLGWAFGPKPIIAKMRSMLAHLGAWAPKPEQIGTAKFLNQQGEVTNYLETFKKEILTRLNILYTAIKKLKDEGHKVDAMEPQGAIYLSVKLDLVGAKTPEGKTLQTIDEIQEYLLDEAKVAIVPFHLFGTSKELPWFRISVGTCSISDAEKAAGCISRVIQELGV